MSLGFCASRGIGAIMEGLAKEMHVLSLQALNIESSLTGLALRECDRELVHDLQLLDLLLQHIGELRDFMRNLSEGLQENDSLYVDRALDAVKLHAIQGRLAESLGRAGSYAHAGGAGDLEML